MRTVAGGSVSPSSPSIMSPKTVPTAQPEVRVFFVSFAS